MALHPVEVAAQRVDLTIVSKHPEGLRQFPAREGVCRIALVIDGDRRDEALILQVEEEIVDVLGKEHALVDQRLVAQRADIEARDASFARLALNPAAAKVKRALKLIGGTPAAVAEHDLLDFGPRIGSFLTDDRDVDRGLAPAIDVEAEMQDFGLDNGTGRFLIAEIGARQENLADADRVIGRVVAGALCLLTEEVLWDLDTDTCAVTGLAVSIYGAAVPDILQGLDAHLDDFALWLAIQRNHEADAAGIFLMLGIIGVAIDQFLALDEVFCDRIGHVFKLPLRDNPGCAARRLIQRRRGRRNGWWPSVSSACAYARRHRGHP